MSKWYHSEDGEGGRSKTKRMSITKKLWANPTIPEAFKQAYKSKYTLSENHVGRLMASWSDEGEQVHKSFAHIVWEFYHEGKRIRKHGRVFMKDWNNYSKDNLVVCERSIKDA